MPKIAFPTIKFETLDPAKRSSLIALPFIRYAPDNILNSANRDTPCCTALVAEDEWLLRIELVDALAASGIDVIEAGSAEEAVAIIDGGACIDVLITDIRLGGPMDGWELAEIFRVAQPAGGVFYASANAAVSGRQVPGSIFFTKPVPMRALVENCLRASGNLSGEGDG